CILRPAPLEFAVSGNEVPSAAVVRPCARAARTPVAYLTVRDLPNATNHAPSISNRGYRAHHIQSNENRPGPHASSSNAMQKYTDASTYPPTNGSLLTSTCRPIATAIVQAMPSDASGVSSPKIHASPPPNSATAASAWKRRGIAFPIQANG